MLEGGRGEGLHCAGMGAARVEMVGGLGDARSFLPLMSWEGNLKPRLGDKPQWHSLLVTGWVLCPVHLLGSTPASRQAPETVAPTGMWCVGEECGVAGRVVLCARGSSRAAVSPFHTGDSHPRAGCQRELLGADVGGEFCGTNPDWPRGVAGAPLHSSTLSEVRGKIASPLLAETTGGRASAHRASEKAVHVVDEDGWTLLWVGWWCPQKDILKSSPRYCDLIWNRGPRQM